MKEISNREKQYIAIVNDILKHKEFIKTKSITHHGLNRYDHSVRVSYYSYKIAKLFRLDYDEVARAGLLHDFFLVDNEVISVKEKMNTLINHPKYAEAYAAKYFDLSDKERDIIRSHMFPVSVISVPKYAESWLVNVIDNAVSICEALSSTKVHLLRISNIMIIVLLNFLRL